jgi:hypothetical protein
MCKAGNKMLISTRHGSVYCIDLETQQTFWATEEISCNSNILIDEERIYFGTSGGSVYCLDLNSGDVIWKDGQVNYTHYVCSVSDTRLLVSSSDSTRILDKASGKELFSFKSRYIYYYCRNSLIYGAFGDIGLICFNYCDKVGLKQEWCYLPNGGNPDIYMQACEFIFADDKILLHCSADGKNNTLRLLEADSGNELAVHKIKNPLNKIVRDGSRFFLFSSKGQVELVSLQEV